MTSRSLDFNNDVYALSIEDKLELYVPQIFSPNNDGVNDVLFAYGNSIESITFVIYNRLGEIVFETNDNTKGWDGKFRGVDSQSGVYIYYLEAKLLEKGFVTQKGDITLVR
jgi:large repetitive protein